ncbi:LegC family aminotransferase [uncultured Ruthenibacterium sp.]|uniref:LegC family aminotransferase n=1 Tax=uncultured Ruthenibacterium sp. TaxID=1905347 RepID=UPI00349EA5B7
MEPNFIPLSVPNFGGREKEYVNDAVVSEWVSTGGSKVPQFEQVVADYVGMPGACACNSGTSGLHLAMMMAGVGPGDEVIAPTLTFIAAVNPIRYAGAQPIFIGCGDSLCICPTLVEQYLEANSEMRDGRCINKRTGAHIKAMVVVHVFGNMANMPGLLKVAHDHNLIVIEDATEALGTYYTDGPFKGKYAGTMGDVGVYSFNGNKIITTGSGRMVVSNHPEWLAHAKHLSTQAKSDELNYKHDEVGYNYRLTNLQAALGLAQMEQLEDFIQHKNEMYDFYFEALNGKGHYGIMPFRDGVRSNKWFYSLYVYDEHPLRRDEIIRRLAQEKIQTRPIWGLIQDQADYPRNEHYGDDLARHYLDRIVNLPCSTNLTKEQAQRVVDVLLNLSEA